MPISAFKIRARRIAKNAKSRLAFTLVEVMAAASIMVILIGAVLYSVGDVLNAWNSSAGKIQGYTEADSLADFIKQDFESIIIKRDGKAWLQVSYPVNVGQLVGESVGSLPMRPPQIMFFSQAYIRPRFDSAQLMNKSTKRTSIPGSICAVKYQLSYKSPFRSGGGNEGSGMKQPGAFYGLYRAVIDSKSTFEGALGAAQGDTENNEYALQRFWNGTCTILNDEGVYERDVDLKSWAVSPENFIASNLVDFQVTFAIMYKKEGMVSEGESQYSVAYVEPGTEFTVADKIYVKGRLYERGSGGGKANVSPKEVENGFLAFAEVSMTFVSDAGALEIKNLSGEDKLNRFKDLRQQYGTTITRKISFVSEPLD
ncbi:MAG: prepilin-type N-terminal cleavage/methylation domain-containing protein [Opitutales bacterium]|nr:prepilin-type N-terminal cleavage/methylation domain-containing protein [Opitutales bacterium]